MYCNKCGNEINDSATFCPFCGDKKEIKESSVKVPEQEQQHKRKNMRFIIAIPVIVIVLAISCYALSQHLIKKTITEQTEMFMESVKNGPGEEVMDEILETAISRFVENETFKSIVLGVLSGENVLDFYSSFMSHMEYEVVGVQKIESGNYSVTVVIANMNNKEVIRHAWNVVTERGIWNTLRELKGADKSKYIAEIFEQSADKLYEMNNDANWIEGEYEIIIKKENGQWKVKTNYIDVAYTCFGLN